MSVQNKALEERKLTGERKEKYERRGEIREGGNWRRAAKYI